MSRLTFTTSGIPPGGQFDYVVPINSSGQWGSYWVHAHSGVSFEKFQGYQALVQLSQSDSFVFFERV